MNKLGIKIDELLKLFRRSDFGRYYKKKKTMIISIILISILMIPGIYRIQQKNNRALIEENGDLVALDTETYGGSAVTVQAQKNGKRYRKNIYVEKKTNKVKDKSDPAADPTRELISDVDEVCRTVKQEGASGNLVVLPKKTANGIELKWTASSSAIACILPIPIGILTVIYLYRNSENKMRNEELAAKNEILRDLPSFTERLVMLLDSGLIYEDALDRIIQSYGERAKKGRLWQFLSETKEKALGSGEEFESLLQREAGKYRSAELTRLITLIAENRYRGQDLRNKLKVQGESLWQERKHNAEERSKIAETKMAIPLGIMLIALIVVTAAPALMQM